MFTATWPEEVCVVCVCVFFLDLVKALPEKQKTETELKKSRKQKQKRKQKLQVQSLAADFLRHDVVIAYVGSSGMQVSFALMISLFCLDNRSLLP